MTTLARRAQRSTNIWPGFVDALANLLLVLVFLLMVFVLAQAFLKEKITGKDKELLRAQSQIGELADLLALERRANEDMRLDVALLTEELQASIVKSDDLNATVRTLTIRSEAAEEKVKQLDGWLAAAFKNIEVDKEKTQLQVAKVKALSEDVAALTALREELENKVTDLSANLKDSESAVFKERMVSDSARAHVALLNKQVTELREQLTSLSEMLGEAEKKAKEQNVQIASLGKRLNAALAVKVQKLSRYRSEFFGRLRELLGRHPGVRIVGDRFVFQSEVLFGSGSANLGEEGKQQLDQLVQSLREITAKIPQDINWILRVDGHTDKVPIMTQRFPSNWELSTGRATSVVKYLISQRIPANRLAAAGFGEHHPLDPRDNEIANRRNRRIELKLTQR
ncbi:MAG: peptidoglycan -binding protein [Rhodospirillales bacterium]